jgi:NAD(P)-dependent dehydrogenase (short-subunit alcohol dehydrogenase family)
MTNGTAITTPFGSESTAAEVAQGIDLHGKRAIVTGGSSGIGVETARALVGAGAEVTLAVRDTEAGDRVAADIGATTGDGAVQVAALDLADQEMVAAFVANWTEPLHVLINNAGVAGRRGLTSDGFELAFGVNHLGHFALTMALLDRLTASAPARVVTVSSDSHYQARGIDFTALRRRTTGLTGMGAYAVSKLCNVLFAQELARRLGDSGVTTYALHPGVVASDIWRRVPRPVRPLLTARMLTTEQGAATSLHCATSADLAAHSGRFYDDCRERAPSKVATPELGKILWDRSEAWTGA